MYKRFEFACNEQLVIFIEKLKIFFRNWEKDGFR